MQAVKAAASLGPSPDEAKRLASVAFRDGCLKLGHLERIKNLYRIQHKTKRTASFFVPNGPQERYLATKKGHDIVLKVRQVGFTTLSCIRALDLALWEPNFRTGIMAHIDKTAASIFQDIVKPAYDWFVKDWSHLYAPTAMHDSANTLAFEDDGLGRKLNSSIRVLYDFRGKTVQFLHVSEAARIELERLQGSLQGVPDNGEIIFESTPNGRGGEFYRLWQLWKTLGDKAPYRGHFVRWFDYYPEHPEDWSATFSNATLTTDTASKPSDPNAVSIELTTFEQQLVTEYDLKPYHIRWRRWCIDAKCQGNPDIFDNEYPADDDRCFLSGENQVFSRSALLYHAKRVKEPLERGMIVGAPQGTPRFIEDAKGWLALWARPKQGHTYVIGADSSAGLGGDASAAYVLHQQTGAVVARIWGQLQPSEFAEALDALARWYNMAFICPESNNMGHTVIEVLKARGYRNIYKRRSIDSVSNTTSSIYGFSTTAQTKLALTEALREALNNPDELQIYDHDLISQLTTFVQVSGAGATKAIKREAAPGAHDDLVMALALTWEMHKTRVIIDPSQEKDADPSPNEPDPWDELAESEEFNEEFGSDVSSDYWDFD